MDRRAFLFSTAWLAVAPAPALYREPMEEAPHVGGGDLAFQIWLDTFVARAPSFSLDADRVRAVLSDVQPDPHVIALDRRQPEFSKPVSAYIDGVVASSRVDAARERRQQVASWLDPISAAYGCGPDILVSIWQVESDFGRVQGEDDVIRSMATLAAEGRRRAFAESELVGALRILFSGEADRQTLKGSWAGAMGQTQFTPLDYLAYAVDGDGDGRRDIWRSAPDALASTANFLVKKAAWRGGGLIQTEVITPEGFDFSQVDADARETSAWEALGVRAADGRPLARPGAEGSASLLAPMGWRGPAFLAYSNHLAVRAYNNSTAYALAVGLLADRIGGAGPLRQAWPTDQPISLADRMAAQEALKARGFYTGEVDGILGADTRKAARMWQASIGAPPDGYLSYALVQQLKNDGAAQGGAPSAAAPAPSSGPASPGPVAAPTAPTPPLSPLP